MKTNLIIAALGVALGLASLNASAAQVVGNTVTGSFSPSLIVGAGCTVSTAGITSGAFAQQAVPSGSTAVDVTMGNIAVLCPGVSYMIGANKGVNGTVTGRLMKSGTHTIPYTLGIAGSNVTISTTTDWTDKGINAAFSSYTDTEMTTGTAGTVTLGAVSGDTFSVTGTATLATSQAVGAYTDTVTVVIAF